MDRNQLLNDPETVHRYAQDGLQSRMWTALPAIVTKVDLSKMTLECQPTIKGVVTNPDQSISYVDLPVLLDVPIVFPGAGGFILTFPIAAGDEVLVIFSSRCIDAWWQGGGVQIAPETRMHDLSDGFAIPGPRSQPKVVSGISSTKAQLRNNAGSVFLEIGASGISIQGNLSVTGSITAQGAVTSGVGPASVTLGTHTHTSTTPGNPTSPPTPGT